ncbi:ATP-grasp domain-containing protein [Pseudomonas sp. F3-2]|uniref:ATP-grasp domain-containing protein n=1 Tax=Pseudomonas sp. F3-2 TaxID=3141539 RepID=UPI00315DEF4F
MTASNGSIVVIDPVSSARRYGVEIRKKGYKSIALITRKQYPGQLQRLHSVEGFDEVIHVNGGATASKVLLTQNVKAVIPGSDSALKFCDQIAKELSVRGNPTESYRARVNKLEMKKRLIAKGVPATQSYEISLDSLSSGLPIELPFPVVVKPSQGTGSKNVKICDSRSDIYKALAAIESTNDSYNSDEKLALVEEFIHGQEYFIATANLGNAASKKILCMAKYEKIQIGNSPSVYKNIRSIPPIGPVAERAFEYIRSINAALDFNVGINDVEFKINQAGHFVIEQNGRLPGANVPSLIELCTGINCYDLNLDLYLGNTTLDISAEYTKHFCICCLISNSNGVLKEIDGVPEIEKLSSFHSASLLVAPGDKVDATMDFLSTWGFVYLVHEDPETLNIHAETVHALMKMKFQEAS